MNKKIQRKLKESYNHIEPYLNEEKELKNMCQYCEVYCGEKHNYEDCLNMTCFKFYLAYSYLEWETSWE